jgi:hypothetical protein
LALQTPRSSITITGPTTASRSSGAKTSTAAMQMLPNRRRYVAKPVATTLRMLASAMP